MGAPLDPVALAGLDYLRAGLSIIALVGKTPNGLIHRHGLKDPFQGADAEEGWLKAAAHPDTTGCGLVLMPHFVVIDIDGEEGRVAFRALVGHEELPETAVAKTARGWHLWYATPQVGKNLKLAEKLDMKGPGGYVAAPPSVHPTGFVYQWLDPFVRDGNLSCDWLPAPIEQVLAERSQVFVAPAWTRGGSIDSLAKHLAGQPEGNRNACLYWASATARDSGIDLLTTLSALVPASALPVTEAERTVRSAFRA